MPPDLIAGRYRVRRGIGQGGMGAVWLCHDERFRRDVAVKQIGRLPGESAPDTARALREARSSAALNHRNVVSVFDVIEDEGEIWLVMEYVPSRTLAEILRADGPLSPAAAAGIGAQIADGLAAAHALGTMHRDVKPGNILVTEDGLAKISDFGIARTEGDEQLTQTGLMTGTPAYFSPELARGGDPGPASDVWALGATMYAAVEGASPYAERGNPIALLATIASENPPRPEHAGFLTEPIGRMMDRDPASRWAMADAAHALRRLSDRKAPPSADAGTTAFAATGAREQEDTPRPAEPATSADGGRKHRLVPWLLALLLIVVLAGGYLLFSGRDNRQAPSAAPRDQSSASLTPSPSRASKPSSSTPSPSRPPSSTPSPSQPPSAQPSPTTASSHPSAESTPPAPKQASDAAEVAAAKHYIDTVPDDTDAGWAQLAASEQSVGRGSYDSFWGSIDDVQASDVRAVADEPAVNLTLTYHFHDGRVVVETQRIGLERSGGDYLIADDEVLSSKTIRH